MERTSREVLLALSIKNEFDWDKTYEMIINHEVLEDDDYAVAQEYLKTHKATYITLIDNEYPDSFKKMNHPPFVIILCGKGGDDNA